MSQTLTITLPDSTLEKLNRAAELTYQTIDEIVAATVETALPGRSDLPVEQATELDAMRFYSDDALWAAVEPTFSAYESRRLGQLSDFANVRDLTEREKAEQSELLDAFDRSVLRRAQALALLKQRGHDISSILAEPANG